MLLALISTLALAALPELSRLSITPLWLSVKVPVPSHVDPPPAHKLSVPPALSALTMLATSALVRVTPDSPAAPTTTVGGSINRTPAWPFGAPTLTLMPDARLNLSYELSSTRPALPCAELASNTAPDSTVSNLPAIRRTEPPSPCALLAESLPKPAILMSCPALTAIVPPIPFSLSAVILAFGPTETLRPAAIFTEPAAKRPLIRASLPATI